MQIQNCYRQSNLTVKMASKAQCYILIEQFSGGDFKTIRGVRIIRVFELIGNLPYYDLPNPSE